MEIIQGSEEWFQERVGHVTASGVKHCGAFLKDGVTEGCTRRDYKLQVATERLSNRPTADGYKSTWMIRGTELEPIARARYEAATGRFVEQVGFVKHPTVRWFGASPDGLVGDDGLLEIKCPKSSTHVGYMLAKKVPSDYKQQMIAQCLCTGRAWVDFVSFDDTMPDHLQLFIIRYQPTEEELKDTLDKVVIFLDEVDLLHKQFLTFNS